MVQLPSHYQISVETGSVQGALGKWIRLEHIFELISLQCNNSHACKVEIDAYFRYIICRGGTEFDVR
jgi:hypothetical protein